MKKKEKNKNKELSKSLYDEIANKYEYFLKHIRENDEYCFLEYTEWFKKIEKYGETTINGIVSFLSQYIVDETDCNWVKKIHDEFIETFDSYIASLPTVVSTIKENDAKFKAYCDSEFSRFFVLEPLFGGQKSYCFSCNKELYPGALKTDTTGFYYLDIAVMKTTNPTCSVEQISSIDYEIRPMYEWEFRDIYLPVRCEKSGITSEIELVKYINELNKLFIEDSINLKIK